MVSKKKAAVSDDHGQEIASGPKPSAWLQEFIAKNEVPTAHERAEEQKQYRVYPSGCLKLDLAVGERDPFKGNYGIPERAIVEAFGRNSSTKSALAEHLTKSVLDDDPNNYAVHVLSEEPDFDRMDYLNIDKRRVLTLDCYKQEDQKLQMAEAQLDLAVKMASDPCVKLVVIDSIKALCSVRQFYTDKGQVRELDNMEALGIRAKLIDSFIRNFKQTNKHAILFMTNQISDRIVMPGGQGLYTNPAYTTQTPGGRGKEFECTLRIECITKPIETKEKHELTKDTLLTGWEVYYHIIKNKYSKVTGNRVAVTEFGFDPPGYRRSKDVLEIGAHLGLIEKKGTSYFKLGEEWVNGRAAASQYLDENIEVRNTIEQLIWDRGDEVYALDDASSSKKTDDELP